jgi:hypothetical protein
VTSACLGLTCKAFYPIHRSQHGTVPLRSSVSFGVEFVNLGLLLQNWVPSNLAYNYKSGKFVKYTTLGRLWIQWERDDKDLENALAKKHQELLEMKRPRLNFDAPYVYDDYWFWHNCSRVENMSESGGCPRMKPNLLPLEVARR